jgi:hypothetical protein
MTLNQIVEEYKKDHVLRLYKEHPDEITRDYINENETRDDYEGREVLELLQNAADQVELGGKISISLNENILTVANTGDPFNLPGVKSLMKSNLSPKRLSKNTIGQKGLGFRSLLNWSNDISIFSDTLSIRFSEKYREAYFKAENILEPTALLVAPEVIENINRNGYDTIIKIKILSDDKITEVKRQLLSIDKYTLLFLNKINELNVEIGRQVTVFKRHSVQDNVIISENDEEYIFNTYSKVGVIDGRNYEIIIAYDESIIQSDNKLYSFFETNINFPIKWKCHATFDLETNRNGIKKSDDNLTLLSELASFICEKASDLEIKFNKPYEAFDSVIKNNNFPAGLSIKGIDFNETFQKFFENAKVLPTFSGDKISLNDEPVFYAKTEFFFKDLKNNHIILESDDKTRNAIIEKYSIQLEDEILIEKINSYSAQWNINEKIRVFLWWETEFPKSKFLPKLVKAMDGDYIDVDKTVYFVRGRDLNIPSWSRIYQLDPVFEQELIKQLKENESFADELSNESVPIIERVIQRYSGRPKFSYDKKLIPHISFRDADVATILTPINASIDFNYEHAKQFVKWLWDNYSDKEDWAAPIDLTFYLPDNFSTVERASNLYFNEKYDNALSSNLFVNEKYKPFISYDEIGIHHDEMQTFKKFIKKLGVHEYPPLVEKNVQDFQFRNLLKPNYLLSKLPRHETDARRPKLINVVFNVIEDLEKIISGLSISQVFEWIMSDSNLHDELSLKHSGKISFDYTAQVQAYRSYSFTDYSISYVKYLFQTSRWLEINEKKFTPNQCIFAYSGLDISLIVPTITNTLIKELSILIGIQQKELRSFLADVGVNSSFIGLESNDFYRVLLELPKLDESGQISEKIYREVIDMDGEISTNSLNHDKFIKEGYVFTRNHDGKTYHLASDSYFSNSIQVNVGNYHLMSTPLRNGSFEVFNKIFGVKKFEEKYKVKRENILNHHENSKFQKYFKEFIKYAHAWSERNENIKKRIDNISIEIVSHIILVDNNESKAINNDYLLITENNSWLIYVDDQKALDYRQISKCIEELFAQVANTTNSEIPNQLGELFRDFEGRKFLVEKHFGSIDAVNQIFQNQIRANLAETLKIPYDAKELDNINFYQFSSIDNSKKLIDLFSIHSKDLIELRSFGFEYTDYIDFRSYYQQQLKNYVSKTEAKYKNQLYLQFKERDVLAKKRYYGDYLKFKNFSLKIEEIENSIYFNYERTVQNIFPIDSIQEVLIDADHIYNENFKYLSNGFDVQKFGDFIDENNEFKSLLYFLDDDISLLIKDEYKIYYETNSINYETNHTTQFNNEDVTLTKSKIKPTTPNYNLNSVVNSHPNTKSSIEKVNKVKDTNGRIAEKMVRDKLITMFSSLKWTSENSDVPSERNSSTNYDMEYFKDGKKYFIEVKAATKTFFMSLAEYNFAKTNSEYYELYLVDIENNRIDGPHSLDEFEKSKASSEFQFSYESMQF